MWFSYDKCEEFAVFKVKDHARKEAEIRLKSWLENMKDTKEDEDPLEEDHEGAMSVCWGRFDSLVRHTDYFDGYDYRLEETPKHCIQSDRDLLFECEQMLQEARKIGTPTSCPGWIKLREKIDAYFEDTDV